MIRKNFWHLVLLMLMVALAVAPLHSVAEQADQSLNIVKSLEPQIPSIMAEATESIKSLIPDPGAYEKTLPAREQIVETSDQLNFRNYAGLSEAYLYGGNEEKAQELFNWCLANYAKILGANDVYVPGLVGGDFALHYFSRGDYETAEPLFRKAIAALESQPDPATTNNLISAYLGLSLICDKIGKKQEANELADKLVNLSRKQGPTASD